MGFVIETQASNNNVSNELDISICQICKQESPPVNTETNKSTQRAQTSAMGAQFLDYHQNLP